ncbi:MAG: mechanosensitive ion channel [Candidatus Omnitrophica bacterium]|nr:mechanosensitive ion channel [Candidatus Omnitrophota bacterium]
MEETLNKIAEFAVLYGINIIAAIAIFIIGKWVANVVSGLIGKMMKHSNVDTALSDFVQNLVKIAILAFVIIAALGRLGIQTASFIAVLGAAGLAVGMALQGSLSNFAAGVLIILFHPFKIGDFIAAGGEKGTVKEISIFNTILSTPDNVRVIVPNAQITSGSITNYSANAQRRVDLVIGVSYSDDLQKTKQVLTSVITSDSRVLKDPAPTVAVSELADSSVNFVVRPWVNAADYWDVYFALTQKIKEELDKNGISIPFPQRDVHVKTTQTAGAIA